MEPTIVFTYKHYRRSMCMGKRKIILLILIVISGIHLYLQFGRDVEVIATTSTTSDQFYEQRMIVAANRLIIPDKPTFAE